MLIIVALFFSLKKKLFFFFLTFWTTQIDTIVITNIKTVKCFCCLHLETSQVSKVSFTDLATAWLPCRNLLVSLEEKKKKQKTATKPNKNTTNHTYINSSKQVKGVRVWESGLLSSFSIFCNKCHGFHREKWRNFLYAV